MNNKTQIFKHYSDFSKREDKKINGVSLEFAKDNPNFEEDNINNTGCWNCTDCRDCTYCRGCTDCFKCVSLKNECNVKT